MTTNPLKPTNTFRLIRAFLQTMRKTNWTFTSKLRTIQNNHLDCPITFVAKQATGLIFSPENYKEAARKIGIAPDLSYAIATAADSMSLENIYISKTIYLQLDRTDKIQRIFHRLLKQQQKEKLNESI